VTVAEAERLAAELDIDVDDIGICHACLSTVTFAIDGGNPHKIRGAVQSMTPYLWEEGLALPARMALARARRRGVANAGEALREVEQLGPRSRVARASSAGSVPTSVHAPRVTSSRWASRRGRRRGSASRGGRAGRSWPP
jgi:hypothetical protein